MDEPKNDGKPCFNAASVYRTTGNYLHKREKFDQARQAYDRAYEYAADDINVLIDRSRFCADAFYPQEALKDAKQALSIDPSNLHALKALAAANSLMYEFEKSITINNSGYKRRIKPGYFREGINQGVSCIKQTIGKDAGDVMTHYLPIIRENAEILQDSFSKSPLQELKSKKHVCRIPCTKTVQKKSPLEAHRKALLSRVLAYKYLDPLAIDKFFLEDLVEDPRLKSANKASSKKLKELASEALQTLTERQNLLHARRLYYTMQWKKTESQRQSNYKKELLQNTREINKMQALQFLKKIEDCRNDNRINDMMRIVKNMQSFLDTKTDYNLPDKDYYINNLYSNVGRGILAQHRLSYTGNYQQHHRRVSFLMGLKSNRVKSCDSVIRNYPKRYGDLDDKKVALKKALQTLEEAENPNMRCWLHYEISQLQRILKNNSLAKYHAQICQKEAEKFKKHVWWLNGCFSLVSSGVQEGDVNAVINMVTDAYKWSKYIGKAEETQEFLLHCVELAKEMANSDHALDGEKRKNDIVNIMDKGVARDTRLLFDKISRVKPGRQFSVLPVERHGRLDMEPVRTKTQQRNLTIIPGPVKRLPRVTLKSISGEVK
ncbi:tetratricopeptide repeat protein 25-like [Phthorimaea operculella]|nr:tetratricopeptide repeat protein 25-like [Phthorimaea operculella]